LEKWIDIVKEDIDGIVVDQKATVYIQKIVVYLLTFITLIAILYIIYAGFKVLTGAGDEEAQWEAKKIIVSVFLGILLMWLSFAIVDFILDVLDQPAQNTNVNAPIN
jgi:TRAP-type C4-dicarboxylate transport system permease small subunit